MTIAIFQFASTLLYTINENKYKKTVINQKRNAAKIDRSNDDDLKQSPLKKDKSM